MVSTLFLSGKRDEKVWGGERSFLSPLPLKNFAWLKQYDSMTVLRLKHASVAGCLVTSTTSEIKLILITVHILFWWCVFLLGKVNCCMLKVIKYILLVSKATSLMPFFTVFTAEKPWLNSNIAKMGNLCFKLFIFVTRSPNILHYNLEKHGEILRENKNLT